MAAAPAAPPFVVVAIPTFRRPEQLVQLLQSLAAMHDRPAMAILIADNDDRGRGGIVAAQALVEQGFPIPIDAFPVAEPGLCHNRNALVARALAHPQMTHVAMLDDDQWVDPDWIATLTREAFAQDADIVAGPVLFEFEGATPDWNAAIPLFRAEPHATGPVDMLFSLTNALSTRACWEATPAPWFDLRFNQIGGEDFDLYSRWKAQGLRFGWTKAAVVHEIVPSDRAQLPWIWRRMWRVGNTDTMVAWKHAGAARRGWLVARTLLMTGAAVATAPLSLRSRLARIERTGRIIRLGGRIAGLTGYGWREYADRS